MVDFGEVFFLELKRQWPSVTREQTDLWWREYVGAPFGAESFEWTPTAARELARSYAEEFGEVA